MKKLSLSLLLFSLNLWAQPIDFSLKAHVFDGGQRITGVELQTGELAFDRAANDNDTFRVEAKGSLPIDPKGNKVKGLYDGVRRVEKAFVNQKGNIELAFSDDEMGNTLAEIEGNINRNVLMDLQYRISAPNGASPFKEAEFRLQNIVDEEVDRFTAKTSSSGLQYQLFRPQHADVQNNEQKRPLIVWLHGNGEGGTGDYQNNQSQLLANRGGVAFVTDEAQNIFGGAYVIVPQVPDTWYNNYSKGYIGKLKALIDEAVAQNNADDSRIYLLGASAGGYMALRMLIEYPDDFAAVSVSAPALDRAPQRGGVETTAAELERIRGKPLWLVHAADDPIISYNATSKRVYLALRDSGALLTVYPNIQSAGKAYNGHFSWIPSLNNRPINPQGEHLFQWLAKQRSTKRP